MAQDIASLESYGARTDWASLAATDPKLAACTATFQGEVGVDWTRPEARAVVAEALLRHDFGITYHAAPGHLVPCVPNRVRYVAWAAKVAGDGVTSALDVGCGASCIIALLLARCRGWRVVASESDEKACAEAAALVAKNSDWNAGALVDVVRVCATAARSTARLGGARRGRPRGRRRRRGEPAVVRERRRAAQRVRRRAAPRRRRRGDGGGDRPGRRRSRLLLRAHRGRVALTEPRDVALGAPGPEAVAAARPGAAPGTRHFSRRDDDDRPGPRRAGPSPSPWPRARRRGATRACSPKSATRPATWPCPRTARFRSSASASPPAPSR